MVKITTAAAESRRGTQQIRRSGRTLEKYAREEIPRFVQRLLEEEADELTPQALRVGHLLPPGRLGTPCLIYENALIVQPTA